MFGVLVFFTSTYPIFTDKIQAAKSKGELLVFRRGHVPIHIQRTSDEEAGLGEKWNDQDTIHKKQGVASIHRQTKIFHWKDVVYDIKIKGKPRRLLDHVDGWVKPGTLSSDGDSPLPHHYHSFFFAGDNLSRVLPVLVKQRFWMLLRVVLRWV